LSYKKFLKSLRPKNWGELIGQEPFDEYRERVGALLPNWPEGPLQDWLHRHYPDAVNHYGWLRFDRMAFRKETWPSEQIYGRVDSHIMRDIEGMGSNIYTFGERRRTRLMRYFLENGTWPVPVILLDNAADIADPWGKHYGQPYHLLEGHLRLGYFRNIYRMERPKLKEVHDLWIVTIGAGDVAKAHL
jgi:hypothetical protein